MRFLSILPTFCLRMSFKKNVGGISFAGRHFDSKYLLASLQDAISFPNPFMQV